MTLSINSAFKTDQIRYKMLCKPPLEKFFSSNASEVEVTELRIEDDEDSEGEADHGDRRHQHFPHLRRKQSINLPLHSDEETFCTNCLIFWDLNPTCFSPPWF